MLTRTSTVAALVPHFRCEHWLGDCLASLVEQTRPLDAIIVIDDGSGDPPVEIVREFPGVTLLAADENVGPYRLIQQVIEETRYEAYLFQDADDWSSRDRLQVLLEEAERTGADLVGCQEVQVFCLTAEARLFAYPGDVNKALEDHPARYSLLHPASLVARDLVVRLGGFATGLRFSGDLEFQHRAVHAARVTNTSRYCYFRRRRGGSLTTDEVTGTESQGRIHLREILECRSAGFASAKKSFPNDMAALTPYIVAPPIPLAHVLGPSLEPNRSTATVPATSVASLAAIRTF